MPLNPLTRKSSLHRMKSGLKRFLDNVEDMREYMYEEDRDDEYEEEAVIEEREASATALDSASEDLPAEIVEDARREEAMLAGEQAQLDQWRSELQRLLQDRQARAAYFKDYEQKARSATSACCKVLEATEGPAAATTTSAEPQTTTAPAPHHRART